MQEEEAMTIRNLGQEQQPVSRIETTRSNGRRSNNDLYRRLKRMLRTLFKKQIQCKKRKKSFKTFFFLPKDFKKFFSSVKCFRSDNDFNNCLYDR